MNHTIARQSRFGKFVVFQARTPAARYGIALLLCGLATGINYALPQFSSQAPFLIFFVATMAAAWFGGWRAGIVAGVISILIIDLCFLQPFGSLAANGISLIRMIFFAVMAAGISWLIDYRTQSGQLIETQRERVEEQERRHNAIVSSAANIAGMGSWECDIVDDTLVWDDEMLRIFGITRTDFGGNHAALLERVHPEDVADVELGRAMGLTSGIMELEFRILRPDGEVRQVYVRGQVTRHDKHGKPVQTTGMAMDVTEQRKIIKDLRKIKERYDAAVLGSAAGIWDWDLLTSEVFYAPRFKELLGYQDAEFPNLPASFVDHLHPDDMEGTSQALRRHLKYREPFNVEYRLRTRSGEYRWFNARAQALWNADGWAYRMAGSIVDISERLLLEERYHQSQRLEAIGRLAGGIAHDFNNMLGVIMVHCEGLHESLPVSSPEWRSIQQIRTASTRSADLTRQLLAFSRRQILMPSILDLNGSVHEISSMINSLIGDDIELVVRPGAHLGHVKADPGQVHQVVMNLMVNARDAMPHGGQIIIETKNVHWEGQQLPSNLQVAAGNYVMLSVSDNGSGMEPEVLQHIFEPFYTTKQQGEGTGLGLATVYGIVKQSEGYVVAESEPGKGTTFKIYLPRVDEELTMPAAEPQKAGVTGGEETILLAEDEPLLREIFRVQLEGAGYTVLEAPNGEEATKVAEHHQEKIHLLLTDLVMSGGTNGLELAAQLNTSQPGIKVVYMTGYTADVIDPKGMSVMQDKMLQKPFSSDSLLRKIREVLAS